MLWTKGYDKLSDIVEAATIMNLVTKSGAFYTVGSKKLQGKDKFVQFLSEDDKLKTSLEKDIQGKIKDMRTGKKVLDDSALDALLVTSKATDDDIAPVDVEA